LTSPYASIFLSSHRRRHFTQQLNQGKHSSSITASLRIQLVLLWCLSKSAKEALARPWRR
jgi:hypothetical protein